MPAVQCPECGVKLKPKASAAGKRVRCPKCGSGVKVPASADAAEPAAVGAAGDFFSGGGPAPKAPRSLPARVKPGRRDTAEVPVYDGAAAPAVQKQTKAEFKPAVAAGVGVVALLLIGVGSFVGYQLVVGGKPVVAPETLVRFEHDKGAFAIDYPEGWTSNGGAGGTGGVRASAVFEGPEGKMTVREGQGASSVADIAGAGGGESYVIGEQDDSESPEQAAHDWLGKMAPDNYSGYSEQAARTIETKSGISRASDFSATSLFGGGIRGIRATVKIGNDVFAITCETSAKDFAVMQPVFEKMIASVSR